MKHAAGARGWLRRTEQVDGTKAQKALFAVPGHPFTSARRVNHPGYRTDLRSLGHRRYAPAGEAIYCERANTGLIEDPRPFMHGRTRSAKAAHAVKENHDRIFAVSTRETQIARKRDSSALLTGKEVLGRHHRALERDSFLPGKLCICRGCQ